MGISLTHQTAARCKQLNTGKFNCGQNHGLYGLKDFTDFNVL